MSQDSAKEPKSTPDSPSKDKEKKRKGLIILSFLGLFFMVLVQRKLLNLGPGLSSNQGVITLVSINISVLTLGFLLYLILRDLYKVFFEREDYGSLQTKMVVSFIGLSLMPTLLIFYFAYLLVGQDRKVWFSESLKESLKVSIQVASDAIDAEEEIFKLSSEAALLKFNLARLSRSTAPIRVGGDIPGSFSPDSPDSNIPISSYGSAFGSDRFLRAFALLEEIRSSEKLATLEWYGPDGLPLSRSLGSLGESLVPPADKGLFTGAFGTKTFMTETDRGTLCRLILPLSWAPSEGPLNAPLNTPLNTPLEGPYLGPFQGRMAPYQDFAGKGPQGTSEGASPLPPGRGFSSFASPPGQAPGQGQGQGQGPPGVMVSPSQPGGSSLPSETVAVSSSPFSETRLPGEAASGSYSPKGYLVAGSVEIGPLLSRLRNLEGGLVKYEAALGIERPFKVSQMTSLAAVTLVAVFLSVWIGRHLASSLSAPVTELVNGVKKVAQGDLDFILSPTVRSGELTELVAAFNQMTRELKESYAELDQRRRFVEIVLRQVSTGVLVFDNDDKVLNLNEAALTMLSLEQREALGSPPPPAVTELAETMNSYPPVKRHIFLELSDGTVLSLMAMRARLLGEDKKPLGSIITFDDVSELEKAQRLAAWREVAKRIAHEVKNPLTPISLAAQRLKRRFGEKLKDDPEGAVIEECTSVIIRQVESMRMLVDEFSQFARLPQANPRVSDITEVIEESLTLFGEAHSGIEFKLKVLERPEVFPFDPVQIGRVVSNLLSNAADAVKGVGKVEIEVSMDDLKGVVVTVKDDGPGLPPGMKEKVFEPYVTSGGGQGLGLSIVKTIVNDHGGFIRVLDRKPKGTAFEFTIPYQKKPKSV